MVFPFCNNSPVWKQAGLFHPEYNQRSKNEQRTQGHPYVCEGKISAKKVAATIGKPYSTLLREINPMDSGAKLGVETFMDIIRATGDATPLERLVQELGFRLLRDGGEHV